MIPAGRISAPRRSATGWGFAEARDLPATGMDSSALSLTQFFEPGRHFTHARVRRRPKDAAGPKMFRPGGAKGGGGFGNSDARPGATSIWSHAQIFFRCLIFGCEPSWA